MKQHKLLVFLSILSASIILFSFSNEPTPTSADKKQVLLKAISKVIEAKHYAPLPIDDEFSERVYHLFLKKLDYQKRFFTQKDLEKFEKFKHRIDDEINNETFEFYELATSTLEERINESELIYNDILNTPFNLNDEGNYESDPEKRNYALNNENRKELWQNILEYAVLNNVANKIKEQKEAIANDDESVEQKDNEALEIEAREKVLKNYNSWFSRLKKLNEEDRTSTYLNSIVQAYDPHSQFYPPKKKEDFDIRLSGKLEGIGATLQEKDGYITVTKVVPGSPAMLQGDLEENDKILKVAQADEEPVDIVDMRLDEAVQLIRGKKGTEVRLTVKKKDGSQKVIPIIRDVIILEETFAKSALIERDNTNYGYIYLPRFYADFQDRKNGRSCSKDIEIELEKLNEQNIEGLVFDLRSNGGGSLSDVVKMAGLFLEKGPIVQVKENNDNIRTHNDRDESIKYNGPLVILVNNFSASASEILAAALQDYERAIIVGESTYGKGTVQRFYDLDKAVSGFNELKPLGSLKITTQKFYRVNGGTTQLMGVEPDIELPNEYSYIDKKGEKELDYVLGWDEIPASKYEHWIGLPNSKKVAKLSKGRLKKNETFNKIDENAAVLGNYQKASSFSLNLDEYLNEICEREEHADKFEELSNPIDDLNIKTIPQDWEVIAQDSIKIELNNKWHNDLQKDVYINEAISILNDIM